MLVVVTLNKIRKHNRVWLNLMPDSFGGGIKRRKKGDQCLSECFSPSEGGNKSSATKKKRRGEGEKKAKTTKAKRKVLGTPCHIGKAQGISKKTSLNSLWIDWQPLLVVSMGVLWANGAYWALHAIFQMHVCQKCTSQVQFKINEKKKKHSLLGPVYTRTRSGKND